MKGRANGELLGMLKERLVTRFVRTLVIKFKKSNKRRDLKIRARRRNYATDRRNQGSLLTQEK